MCCKLCESFKEIPFNESYKECIDMEEFYNSTLEENIYLESYLYKPALTSAIYLTTDFSIFNVETPQRLRIKYCPFCGEKIEQDYYFQQNLFKEGIKSNE